MIISREIKVKITDHNYQYYDDLGYDTTIGEHIVIPVELLPKGSHHKIKCKCDGCGLEKDVIFKNYLKYGNVFGEYSCRKCSEEKRKKTLRKNYGVDYPIQNKRVHGKMKSTLIEKYGVDNISKKKRKDE
jgi:hypothetical protein